MQAEQIGKKPPPPIVVQLPEFEIDRLARIAGERNAFRDYAASADKWKSGMIENPILKGLLGECALCCYLKNHGLVPLWDTNINRYGDCGIDLMVNGVTIQVKTGVPWIRRFTNNGKMQPLVCDCYVFAEKSRNATAAVNLMGWVLKEHLTKLGPKRPQGHFNIEVSPTEFEPMHRLIVLLKSYG